MTKETILDKLLEKYPSGFIGGRVRAVVGQIGMVIQWINPDTSIGRVSMKEDDEVSVIHVVGESLEISGNGLFYKAVVSPQFFKKFLFTEGF